MSAPMLLLFLVIFGAVLFFAAGYLFRLLQSFEKGASKKQLLVELDEQREKVEALKQREIALSTALSDTKELLVKTTGKFNRTVEENERLKAKSAKEESTDDKEASASELEAKEARIESSKDSLQIAALKQEIAETKRRLSRANVSLGIAKEDARKLRKEISALDKPEEPAEKTDLKLDDLTKELEEAKERIAALPKLERENRYLRKEVQHLSTQVIKTKKAPKSSTLKLKRAFDAEIKEVVSDLLEMDQVDSVVVTDIDGTMVGGVGDSKVFKGLAELCGQVASVGQDTETPPPIKAMRLTHLKDIEDGIVACRIFTREGETYVLGTMGRNSPPGEGMMELTIADLSDDQ